MAAKATTTTTKATITTNTTNTIESGGKTTVEAIWEITTKGKRFQLTVEQEIVG